MHKLTTERRHIDQQVLCRFLTEFRLVDHPHPDPGIGVRRYRRVNESTATVWIVVEYEHPANLLALGLVREAIRRDVLLPDLGGPPAGVLRSSTVLDRQVADLDRRMADMAQLRRELIALKRKADRLPPQEGCYCAVIEHARAGTAEPKDVAEPKPSPTPPR